MDYDNRTDGNCNTTLLQPEFFAVCALEGIMVKGAERDIMHEIRKGVHQEKHKDAVLVVMKELEKSKEKMLQSLQ